jgi:hypothetical protein
MSAVKTSKAVSGSQGTSTAAVAVVMLAQLSFLMVSTWSLNAPS